MPELPEVETIRMYLHSKIIGKNLHSVEVINPKSFIGSSSDITSATVTSTSRKGKVLNIHMDNGRYIAIHLKMAGQILFSESRENAVFPVKIPLADDNKMPARTTRVILNFTDGSCMFFNDLRKFGWVKVSDKAEGTNAPDVTRKEFTLEYFDSIVSKSGKQIKTLLMDQDKLAGLGNIYANDSLFVAKILPHRIAKTLSKLEIEQLYEAIKVVIGEGIKFNGTSATEVYVVPDGTKGSYQDHFKVYGRKGEPCLICKTPIIREKHMGRGNFFCPFCQK
jgi:formamidopyrimidine-DNA glycosylase